MGSAFVEGLEFSARVPGGAAHVRVVRIDQKDGPGAWRAEVVADGPNLRRDVAAYAHGPTAEAAPRTLTPRRDSASREVPMRIEATTAVTRPLCTFPWEFRPPRHRRSDVDRLASLRDRLPFALDAERGPWVAGGSVVRAILGEPEADLDVFCATEGQIAGVELALLRAGGVEVGGGSAVCRRRFELLRLRVDLVRDHAPLATHASRFDFTACALATDGVVVVGSIESFADAFAARLRFLRQTTPERVRKYLGIGLAPEFPMAETYARLVRGEPVSGYTSADLTRDEALGLRPVRVGRRP